LKVVAWDNNSF